MRSGEPSAFQVGATCMADCADEKTGITRQGLSANIGVRQARAEASTLSSGSQNLLASPLTCMWSAPARRHSFCQAT
jgi:hypothetical protein